MILNIRHTGIVVSNLAISIDFYTRILGFRIVSQKDEPGHFIDRILGLSGTELTTVKMSLSNDQMIELLYFHSHKESQKKIKNPSTIGITHFAVTVDNIAETYRKLGKLGVEFISSPETSPDEQAIVAFCKDPDGNYIELVQKVK
jgi:lactoylglutathione lyase